MAVRGVLLGRAIWPNPGTALNPFRCVRGSVQAVDRVLWSTKYGRPSGVKRCSVELRLPSR